MLLRRFKGVYLSDVGVEGGAGRKEEGPGAREQVRERPGEKG